MKPFEPLIGLWNLEIVDISPDGASASCTGSWEFNWGLAGRAVLDEWIVPGREHGLTVRFYDPAIEAWRSTWLAPAAGIVVPFIGHAVDGRIVLEGAHRGHRLRWSFGEIRARTFEWTGEIGNASDDGWRIEQTMFATRVR